MKRNTNHKIVSTCFAASLRKAYHHYGTTGKSVIRFCQDCKGMDRIRRLHMGINRRTQVTANVSVELARENGFFRGC